MDTDKLTIQQKVGQIMMFGYLTPDIPEQMKEWIVDKHISNIILFGRNITSVEETYMRMRTLQSWAKESGQQQPLLIATDQENGVVTRLKEGSTALPGAMTLGATWNPALAKDVFSASGTELRAAGINMNLSPIVDVNNNPHNPVIGVRSFGEDAGAVTALGLAGIQGFEQSGVVSTLKHFPGHGDTELDSHLTLPTIAHSKNRLNEIELAPFKAGIDQGAPVVMIAHVNFPAFDDSGLPATVSQPIVTGLLREELGFKGVIMSDCMEMDAVAKTIGSGEAAVQAINAGIDLILVSHRQSFQEEVYERVLQAALSGEIEEKKLNEAVEKIVSLKNNYLHWGESLQEQPPGFDRTKHEAIARQALTEAVTLVRNDDRLIPLKPNNEETIAVIIPAITGLTLAEEEHGTHRGLAFAMKNYYERIESVIVETDIAQQEVEQTLSRLTHITKIVVCTYNAQMHEGQVSLIKALVNEGKDVIVVALRNPYDLMLFPEVSAYVAAYEFKDAAMSVVADILFGKREAKGRLPVHIPNQYPIGHGIVEK